MFKTLVSVIFLLSIGLFTIPHSAYATDGTVIVTSFKSDSSISPQLQLSMEDWSPAFPYSSCLLKVTNVNTGNYHTFPAGATGGTECYPYWVWAGPTPEYIDGTYYLRMCGGDPGDDCWNSQNFAIMNGRFFMEVPPSLVDKSANGNNIANLTFLNDPNLQAYYKLEDTNDSKGANNLTNNNSTTFTSAKFSNGADFGTNNTDKSLSTSNTLGIDGGAITMSAWVKIRTEPTSGAQQFIADQLNNTSKVNYWLRYDESGGTKYLRFARVGLGAGNTILSHAVTLGTSSWHHVVGTYDGTNVRLYVDGSLVAGPTAASGNGSSGGNAGFRIGDNQGGGNYASAYIDDVAIFNRSLTASEVSTIYGSTAEMGETDIITNLEAITGNFLNDSSLVALYKLEDTSASKGSASLTNNNSVSFTSAKYSNGADFGTNNTNKSLSTSNTLGIDGGTITLSAWTKIRTEPTSGAQYFITDQFNNTSKVNYYLRYDESSGTKYIRFGRIGLGSANVTLASYAVTLGTSSWHHVVGTYDGTNVRLYLDGALVAGPTAASGNGSSGSTAGFKIGDNLAGGNYASAYVDDVAVYNRALTAIEVSSIYQSTTGHAAMYDRPFFASHVGVTLASNLSQYLSANDSASLSITGSMTIESWVKFSSLPSSGNKYAIVTKWNNSGSDNRSYGLWLYNNGGTMSLLWGHSTDGSDQVANQVSVPWTPIVGKWYQIAAVYDSTVPNVKFYVDAGQQGSTQSVTGTSIYNSTASLGIGAKAIAAPTEYFDGTLDEVRIWNTTRTISDIGNYNSAEFFASESGLAAYYPFD